MNAPLVTSERIPPHDLHAETTVLSAVILDPPRLSEVFWITPDDFYSPANRRIWEAITALSDTGTPIDEATVAHWLKSRERLAEVGGLPYIAKILDAAPVVANVATYARTIQDKRKIRATILAAQRIAAEGYGDVGDVSEWVQGAEAKIHELSRIGNRKESNLERVGVTLRAMFKRAVAGHSLTGVRVPLGIPALDKIFQASVGDVVVVAGRPGMGKSALACGMGASVASMGRLPDDHPNKVYVQATAHEVFASLICSAEMPKEQVAMRLACAEARVPINILREGKLTDYDWGKMTESVSTLDEVPIWCDDTAKPTVAYVRNQIRQTRRELRQWSVDHPDERSVELRLVVVDYLQIMGVTRSENKTRNREQEISETTRDLKELAKSAGVVIVLLSQLSRDLEKRPNKRPVLSDLRESGAIEQDADSVIFVYRHGYYDKGYKHQDAVELLIEKQRNGPTGRAFASFRGAFTLFEEMTESEREQIERENQDEPIKPGRGRRAGMFS